MPWPSARPNAASTRSATRDEVSTLPAGHRGRRPRVEQRALGRHDGERPVGARAGRHVGVGQHAQREVAGGQRHGERAVEVAVVLRRRAREVELDLVALDRGAQLAAPGRRRRPRARRAPRGSRPPARRSGRGCGARRSRASRACPARTVSRPKRSISAATRSPPARPAASCARRSASRWRGLRMRPASVVRAPRRVSARRRDHHALVVERARDRGHAARLLGAHVGVVRAARGEADQLAVVEERRDHRDVRQVRAAAVGVVEDPGLAGRAAPRRARPPRPTASRRGAPGCARPASPSGRRRRTGPVEASRRSLMFAECAERTSTAPISSQAARRLPSITWSVIGSMAVSERRRDRRGGRFIAPSPPGRLGGRASPRAPRASTRAARTTAAGPSTPPSGEAVPGGRPRLGAGQRHGHAHGHELEPGAPRPSSRSAPRGRGRRRARSSPGPAPGRPGPAARRPGPRSAGRRWRAARRSAQRRPLAQLLAPALRQPLDRRARFASASASSPVRRTLSTRSRRRSATTSPKADSTPLATGTSTRRMPSSSAICGGVQRAGSAERHERQLARVDAALDRHDAHGLGHRGARHAGDARGGLLEPEAELVRQRAHRALGGRAVEPHAAGERRVLVEVAEQQVGVRHRRLARRRARSRPARGRPPPSAAPRAARRPRRARRSSRRRRRPCGRRPSAAPAPGRRPRGRCPPRPRRRRSATRRSDVPPMSRPTASAAPRHPRRCPTAPPAGPDSTVHEAWRAAVPALAVPPLESITSGSGSPASRARSVSRSR